MGSNNNYNIKFTCENFGNDNGGGTGKPLGLGNFGLARQSSIYSLTFDELQNALGGIGKDYGSMNMDELLKNICSAEETQPAVGSNGQDWVNSGGYLQRQGSWTLPRTISQKKVDDVFKDIAKEFNGNGSNLPQKQQTLGEITLEEFLVRAGVVREDTQLIGNPNNSSDTVLFGKISQPSANTNINTNNYTDTSTVTNTGMGINFQQPGRGDELMGNRFMDTNHQMPLQSANMPLNVNGVGMRGGMVGLGDPGINSNGDLPSVSPVPYMFNGGGIKGRRGMGTVDKVVERRQRRMINNRESAARSRARKQAYTMELEQEVQKLKEENQELRNKRAKIMEMQKNQVMEMMNAQSFSQKNLRRTHTGPL